MRPFPTRTEWAQLICDGYVSNGCSYSPDSLIFSPFKIANGSMKYPPLPCDLHDVRYQQGGGEMQRAEADVELYLGVLMVAEAAGELHPAALNTWREQALTYFAAVRRYAARNWNYSEPVP